MIENSKIMMLTKEAREMAIAAEDGIRLALDGVLSPLQKIR